MALTYPRVHLPWPLIPSLRLMMSLPGSHANGTGGPQGPLLGERKLHLRKLSSTQSNVECLTTDGAHTLHNVLHWFLLLHSFQTDILLLSSSHQLRPRDAFPFLQGRVLEWFQTHTIKLPSCIQALPPIIINSLLHH